MKKLINSIKSNDYVFAVISRIIVAITGLSYSILFSRYFQASLRGSSSVISTYADLIVVFLCLGMYQGYPYYKKKSDKNIYEEFVNTISAFFIAYMCVAGIVLIFLWGKMEISTVILITPLMFGTQQFNYVVLIENPQLRNSMSIFLSIFDNILVVLFFVIMSPNVNVLIIFLVIKETVYFLTAFAGLRKKISTIRPSFRMALKYVKFGIVPMLTILMMDLNYKADIVMLDFFKVEKSEIGIYSLGLSLAQKMWMIPDSLKDVLLSKLAKGREEYEVCKIIRISLWVLFLCVVILALVGKIAVLILYGEEYINAYGVMLILLFGIIGMVFYKMIYSYNVVNGLQKINLIILGIAAITNIVLNYILIPQYGIYGASVASTISYSLCGLLFLHYFKVRNNFRLREIILIKKRDIRLLKDVMSGGTK